MASKKKTTPTVVIENDLNKPDGTLPFGLHLPGFAPTPEHDPKRCSLVWMCNYGLREDTSSEGGDTSSKDPPIVSVFVETRGQEVKKDPKYLKDLAEARHVRDELIKNGWKPMKGPEVNIRTDKK